ncbi:hypothetical protein D3C85_1582540 [compost metagenome]
MHDRDFLAAIFNGVLKGKPRNALAAFTGVDATGNGDRPRIVTHRDVILIGDVETRQVLPNEYQINVLITSRDQRLGGTDIAEQFKCFAQPHVG